MAASVLHTLVVVAAVGAGPDPRVAVRPAHPPAGAELGAEDARFLDWLMETFVFDPARAAAFVQVSADHGTDRLLMCGNQIVERGTTRDGWLVRGTNGDPDRIYFTDGESIVAPATGLRLLDLVPGSDDRKIWIPPKWENVRWQVGEADVPEVPNLVRAAWLHRRGYDRQAAAVLAGAWDRRDDPIESLRVRLALRANAAAVRAFANRNDVEAVAHVNRLYALYPDLVDTNRFLAGTVAADIRRRQRAGTGCRVPPTGPPAEFATWDEAKKIAFLIASLDEVGGGDDLFLDSAIHGTDDNDWRMAGLVAIGDPAVPALIDAFECDTRLTRLLNAEVMLCCGKGRIDRRAQEVVWVQTVVNGILRQILRTNEFDPLGEGRNDDDNLPAAEAARLRRYWARYGRLPMPERMKAILTDPAAQAHARYQAAVVLAEGSEESSWSRDSRSASLSVRPSPAVARFSGPTVAAAIFTAMEQSRVRLERGQDAGRWKSLESGFVRALADLGDPRAGPELARRAAAARTPTDRLMYAEAAYRLGTTGPLVTLARDVATGTVRLLPADRPGSEIKDLLEGLVQLGLPETDDALYAVADPRHPYFARAAQGVLIDADFRNRQGTWNNHPVCVAVLKAGLSDMRWTGGHSYLRGSQVEDRPERWPRVVHALPGSDDPSLWFEHVEHRAADEAMDRLAEVMVGLPDYHPLRRDADRLIAETRQLVTKYGRNVRRLSWDEQRRFDIVPRGPTYVPDIRPLGRPATAGDVTAGRAVFALPGGRVADVKLPAWLVLKADAGKEEPPKGLVVQAEVGPDGALVYGVIFRHAIRAVPAEEVEKVIPFER